MTHEQREPSPYVSIAPGMQGGVPCINGGRLTVDAVVGQVWGGAALAELQASWDYLRRADVLVACWYVGTHGSRTWQKRWGAWAMSVHGALWHCTTVDYETVPWPPIGEARP